MSTQIYLMEALTLPPTIHNALPGIREEALDACMKVVADRFAELDYPVSGDFTPGEVVSMEAAVEAFARSMALNNEAIAKLNNDEDETVGYNRAAQQLYGPEVC